MVRANRARTVLQAAADAAVLAEGASDKNSTAELVDIADRYIEANGAESAVEGLQVVDAVADAASGTFQVRLTGKVRTSFMVLAGIDTLDVEAYFEAKRGSSGPLELVLALDTTYSMSANDKIGTLKTAAKALVDSVMVAGKAKVGVVPFADYLNISKSYIGKPWLTIPANVHVSPATGPIRTGRDAPSKPPATAMACPTAAATRPARTGESR
ncbi:MAG: VWA domain-containing protein [Alphaproteobacteria bacterium]|nr:VWA domain-containing protein [Alphaproteobacteria bacterium]